MITPASTLVHRDRTLKCLDAGIWGSVPPGTDFRTHLYSCKAHCERREAEGDGAGGDDGRRPDPGGLEGGQGFEPQLRTPSGPAQGPQGRGWDPRATEMEPQVPAPPGRVLPLEAKEIGLTDLSASSHPGSRNGLSVTQPGPPDPCSCFQKPLWVWAHNRDLVRKESGRQGTPPHRRVPDPPRTTAGRPGTSPQPGRHQGPFPGAGPPVGNKSGPGAQSADLASRPSSGGSSGSGRAPQDGRKGRVHLCLSSHPQPPLASTTSKARCVNRGKRVIHTPLPRPAPSPRRGSQVPEARPDENPRRALCRQEL